MDSFLSSEMAQKALAHLTASLPDINCIYAYVLFLTTFAPSGAYRRSKPRLCCGATPWCGAMHPLSEALYLELVQLIIFMYLCSSLFIPPPPTSTNMHHLAALSSFPLLFAEYRTVAGVSGPLVVLEKVKVGA